MSATMPTSPILSSPRWRSSSKMATRWSGRKLPGNDLFLHITHILATIIHSFIIIISRSIAGGSSSRRTWRKVATAGASPMWPPCRFTRSSSCAACYSTARSCWTWRRAASNKLPISFSTTWSTKACFR